MKKGIAYGVGVGPGDPELMTLKAVRLITENDIIALPGEIPEETAAYKIALQAVPALAQKQLISIYMPMVHDKKVQLENHEKGAAKIASFLDQGKNVVYLTLGDSSIYCTFSYLQHLLHEKGYQTELVSGIPSFCAAAATVNVPIVEWQEPLHVIPAVHRLDEKLDLPGTYVLMKSGSRMKEVRELLRQSGRRVCMVENCGMPDEKIYLGTEEIPDEAGYFSLIIAKEPE